MGKLVVTEFISLDGVIEDPGGAEDYEHGGWTFKFDSGEAGGAFKFEELQAADAQLLGRVTYEGFAKAWPTMEGTGEFGEKMNSMPKFVVSKTLDERGLGEQHDPLRRPGRRRREAQGAVRERPRRRQRARSSRACSPRGSSTSCA